MTWHAATSSDVRVNERTSRSKRCTDAPWLLPGFATCLPLVCQASAKHLPSVCQASAKLSAKRLPLVCQKLATLDRRCQSFATPLPSVCLCHGIGDGGLAAGFWTTTRPLAQARSGARSARSAWRTPSWRTSASTARRRRPCGVTTMIGGALPKQLACRSSSRRSRTSPSRCPSRRAIPSTT